MAVNAVEFVLKARNEATRELQRVSGDLGKMSMSVGRVVGAAGGLAVVATTLIAIGGAALMTAKHIGDAAESLDRQARSSGTSAAQTQAMNLAFVNAGLTIEDAQKAMIKLNIAIGRGDPMLKSLGITTNNANVAFQQLGKMFRESDETAKKAYISQMLFGKGMGKNAGVLGDVAEATVTAEQVLASYGATMDDAAMKQGLALDQRMDALHTRSVALHDALIIKVAPALIAMADLMNKVADAAMRWKVFEKLPGLIAAMLPPHIRLQLELMSKVLDALGKTKATPPKSVAGAGAKPKKDPLAGFKPGMSIIGYDEDGSPIWGATPKAAKGGVNVGGRQMPFVHGEGFDQSEFWNDLAKGLKTVEVAELKLGRSGQIVAAKLAMVNAAFDIMAGAVANSINQTVSMVFSGTVSIGDAFGQLIVGIMRSLAEAAAQLGIGIGLSILGLAIGGPIGMFVGTVGSRVGGFGIAPAMNVNIQAIDRSGIARSLTAPRGELRQAMNSTSLARAY